MVTLRGLIPAGVISEPFWHRDRYVVERLKAGALWWDDVHADVAHDERNVIARRSDSTLALAEVPEGVVFEIDAPSWAAQEADGRGVSFVMDRVVDLVSRRADGWRVRSVLCARLCTISVGVVHPAYPQARIRTVRPVTEVPVMLGPRCERLRQEMQAVDDHLTRLADPRRYEREQDVVLSPWLHGVAVRAARQRRITLQAALLAA